MELSPKEKALEIAKFIFEEQHTDTGAKMILLSTPAIAYKFVDEIIRELESLKSEDCSIALVSKKLDYWNEVKREMVDLFENKNNRMKK